MFYKNENSSLRVYCYHTTGDGAYFLANVFLCRTDQEQEIVECI